MKISDEVLYQHAAEARDLWLETLPKKDEVPEHTFSGRFQKKMRRLLAEQRRSPHMNALIHSAKRIAVVAVVILAVTFSGLMSVRAYREKLIQIVTQVFEDLTSFRFSSDEGSSDALTPAAFGYLPDGVNELEREQTPLNLYIHFENDEGEILDITQTQITESSQLSMILDTEDADTRHFDIHGEDAISTSKKGVQMIVFTQQHYIFEIYSTLSMDEVKHVAEQIQIK